MANEEQLAILKQGVEAWNKWREDNPDVKIDLAGAKLSGAYLSGAKLRNADLRGANLSRADLSRAKLSRANISGADLRWAILSKASVVSLEYDRKLMHGKYLGIRRLDSCYGNSIFKRDAQDQDYIDAFRERSTSFWGKVWLWIWEGFDFGRSILGVGAFAFLIVSFFQFIYSLDPGLIAHNPTRNMTIFTPFYFSLSIFTSLGFGDITPQSLIGEILVSIEVLLGYVTLGLLLAILANTVARRS